MREPDGNERTLRTRDRQRFTRRFSTGAAVVMLSGAAGALALAAGHGSDGSQPTPSVTAAACPDSDDVTVVVTRHDRCEPDMLMTTARWAHATVDFAALAVTPLEPVQPPPPSGVWLS